MPTMTINPVSLSRLVIALCILLAAAFTAHARDIHVNEDCSLRNAITAANTNKKVSGCAAGEEAGDTIIMTIHDNITRALPEIESNITLEGAGHVVTFRQAPAFRVDDSLLLLKNLHLRFRHHTSADVMEVDDSKLTLANTFFHDCTGAIDVDNSSVHILGDSNVCGHSHDTVRSWFGIFPPPPPTCAALTGATVSAPLGLASGVQCQNVGVANQAVVAQGVIGAVDVWGYLGNGVTVCFPQVGAMIFLDAATAPRSASWLDSYGKDGATCASISKPGTVVLVQGEPTMAVPPATVSEPEPGPAQPASEAMVDGCPIKTFGHIYFRAEPSLDAEKLGVVSRGSTVGSISRIWGWYQINFLGRTGWIGGKYVDNIGNC